MSPLPPQRFLRACLLLIPFVLCAGHALGISVTVFSSAATICNAPNGQLEAMVQGGTPPYRYDWYETHLGMPGQEEPYCMDCSNMLGGLSASILSDRGYYVVVTDAIGDMATSGVESVPNGWSGWFDLAQNPSSSEGPVPYLAGASPVVMYHYGGEFWQSEEGAFSSSVTPSIAQAAYFGLAYPGRTYVAVLPPGTSSFRVEAGPVMGTGSVYEVCPSHIVDLYVPAPTVLPAASVLQVQPSCSNGSTGRIEFALTNGVIPQGIFARLKSASGAVVGTRPFLSSAMPTATEAFSNVAPGNYWLVVSGLPDNTPYDFGIPGFIYTCQDSIAVTVPSTGLPCGQVQGSVFIDANANCSPQGSETRVPGVTLKVEPGPVYITTSSTGAYALQLPPGQYTIEEQHPQIGQSCSGQPIPFTLQPVLTPVNLNVPCTSLVAMDARIALTSGPARPGFELRYALAVRNNTPASTGAITITAQLDHALAFVSADPAPTSVNGSTLTWNGSALGAYLSRSVSIITEVPPDVDLLGTELATTATLTTTVTDGNPGNNTAVCLTTVTGSYDPNDKFARTSSGSRTYYTPAQDAWIDYTIRFQNTGTDTAFNVLITDTLPIALDPGSFEVGSASHAFTWSMAGRGTLKFQFLNIQLPDSNVNEPGSHGFVSFRIKPRAGYLMVPGEQVSNTANIFFDFNPPVITDPCVLQVPQPGVLLNARMLLEAVDGAGDGLMNDALRAQGSLPLHEPYTAAGYVHAGGGGAVIAPAVLAVTGTNAIVDWVVVELRDPAQASTVVRTASALLQRDGDVVALDGVSPLQLPVPAGSYFVAVRHRNHLGVMTASAIPLNTSVPVAVDFTTASTAVHGTDARAEVGGRLCLWAGDCDGDGTIKYTGGGNDRDPVLQAIGGTTPTNTLHGVYSPLDANLDGTVKYTGLRNDRDVILRALGGTTPTATRAQQLP